MEATDEARAVLALPDQLRAPQATRLAFPARVALGFARHTGHLMAAAVDVQFPDAPDPAETLSWDRVGCHDQPTANVYWLHNVFGKSVAIAEFSEPGSELLVESSFRAEHYPLPEKPGFCCTFCVRPTRQLPSSGVSAVQWGGDGCHHLIDAGQPNFSA